MRTGKSKLILDQQAPRGRARAGGSPCPPPHANLSTWSMDQRAREPPSTTLPARAGHAAPLTPSRVPGGKSPGVARQRATPSASAPAACGRRRQQVSRGERWPPRSRPVCRAPTPRDERVHVAHSHRIPWTWSATWRQAARGARHGVGRRARARGGGATNLEIFCGQKLAYIFQLAAEVFDGRGLSRGKVIGIV